MYVFITLRVLGRVCRAGRVACFGLPGVVQDLVGGNDVLLRVADWWSALVYDLTDLAVASAATLAARISSRFSVGSD